MPLNLAEINQQYMIQKICGDEEQRHYLETLGFVENAAVRILSVFSPQRFIDKIRAAIE